MIGWRDGKMSRQTELVILVGGVSINMSRRWRWETQRVTNPKNPVAVWYGWADFPEVNLWNKEGLPARPSARTTSQ